MTIEKKGEAIGEEAVREGTAVGRMAELLMRRRGAKGGPTRGAYNMASKVIEMSQAANRESAELFIGNLNIWVDIEGAIGETEARRLRSIQDGILDAHGREITEFLSGEREIEGVLDILEKAFEEDEVGGRMIKEHPDLKRLLAEERGVFLRLIDPGADAYF